MLAALNGQAEGATLFYQAFLDDILLVPNRFQEQPLQHQPSYPNDFLDIIAVQSGDKITVPAFSRNELVTTWCDQELKMRKITGKALVEMIPDNWHICLNPSAEVEKEFSPWEIAKLRQGRENISEIVSELYMNDLIEVLQIEEVISPDYDQLKKGLASAASSFSQISKLYFAQESGKDINGTSKSNLLLGIETSNTTPSELEEIQEKLTACARIFLIGDQDLKVRVGASGSASITLGIFKEITPFYRAPNRNRFLSLLKRIF